MTHDLKPYPEYKDSGVEWLGRIPVHWSCLPHRALFKEIKDQGHIDEQLLSVTISQGIIRQADLLAESSKKDSSNLDKSKYKLVVPGDIAYNKMRAWQGAVGVSRYRGIVSPAYIVVRLRTSHNPNYFHFLFRTPAFATEAERWSYGITSDQWSLRPEHFKMIYSCVPPRPEQDAIVAFLRQLDGMARRFIRNRRLIKVLNEQKQAIINRAVTRGLDPNVFLKSSGVEWLGEIPEHWRLGRVKTEMDNLNTRRIPLSASERGKITLRKYDYYGASGVIDKVDEYLFDDDLLLIAEDGANLVLRNLPLVIIARGKFWVNNHAHILKPKRGSLEYFAALLECIDYLSWITGAAQPKLTQDRLMAIRIPVPPEREQRQIANWIAANTSDLSVAISRAQREINLIREYRTRLISDVVTGKVDVRRLAPETAETDPEDFESREIDEGIDDEVFENTADMEDIA